jgi:lantibiotic modifying enzyme
MDLLGGVAGALAVSVALHQIFGDEAWLPVIASLISTLKKGGEPVGRHFVWRQRAISCGPDDGLCGLSHGQSGCALALAEAAIVDGLPASVRRDAARLSQQAIGWELARFSSDVCNFPDFRRRATLPREGEFAWSHGALGTLYASHRIRACIEAPEVERFIDAHSVTGIVDWAVHHRASPNNASLCHGALGVYLLAWVLLRAEGASDEVARLQHLSEWSGLARWAEFEARPLRQHAMDAPGFMVGRAGSLAGWLAVATSRPGLIPFLPHVFIERAAHVGAGKEH